MAGRRILGVPVPVALFFLGMMLPTSVGITAGGLRLSAYRVVLIVMFLPMLVQLLSGRQVRANLFDALVLGHCTLALASLIRWGGLQQGIESGGIYIVGLSLCAYGLEAETEDVWRGRRGRTAVVQVIQYAPPTGSAAGSSRHA